MKKKRNHFHFNFIIATMLLTPALLCGCENASSQSAASVPRVSLDLTDAVKGSRDNTPQTLIAEHPGTCVYSNDFVTLDTSNSQEGYICVSYNGSCNKVKLQITCPNTTTYTYNLHGGFETLPLTTDSGTYRVSVFENIQDTQYSTVFSQTFDVSIENNLGPYLYPNQYVNFTPDSDCVSAAQKLAYSANTDLDVVTNVYNYVVSNITYDTELAANIENTYLPDADRTLNTQKGICLDYSALMAAMLRSQNIPTHLEVGYAGRAYHAWISVFLDDTGWVNGIIEFNGTDWELMDPTFASSSDNKKLKNFIGDGSNYEAKYVY